MSTGTPRYGMDCTTHRPISSVHAAMADYGNALTLSGEHAEIARRLAELPAERRLPFMTPSEVRRYHGYEPAATNLRALLAAASPWPEPGYDVSGLPVPDADRYNAATGTGTQPDDLEPFREEKLPDRAATLPAGKVSGA